MCALPGCAGDASPALPQRLIGSPEVRTRSYRRSLLARRALALGSLELESQLELRRVLHGFTSWDSVLFQRRRMQTDAIRASFSRSVKLRFSADLSGPQEYRTQTKQQLSPCVPASRRASFVVSSCSTRFRTTLTATRAKTARKNAARSSACKLTAAKQPHGCVSMLVEQRSGTYDARAHSARALQYAGRRTALRAVRGPTAATANLTSPRHDRRDATTRPPRPHD